MNLYRVLANQFGKKSRGRRGRFFPPGGVLPIPGARKEKGESLLGGSRVLAREEVGSKGRSKGGEGEKWARSGLACWAGLLGIGRCGALGCAGKKKKEPGLQAKTERGRGFFFSFFVYFLISFPLFQSHFPNHFKISFEIFLSFNQITQHNKINSPA